MARFRVGYIVGATVGDLGVAVVGAGVVIMTGDSLLVVVVVGVSTVTLGASVGNLVGDEVVGLLVVGLLVGAAVGETVGVLVGLADGSSVTIIVAGSRV